MSGEFAESTQEPRQRLASIEQHFDTPLDPSVVEFAHLLSDRLNPELVPMGFVMAGKLLAYDLHTGINGFTDEPIDSNLVQQSPKLYEELQDRIPAFAKFAFPPEFADEVATIIEEVTGMPVTYSGKTTEEVLAEPIKAERMLAPNMLPDAGVVEIAAELEDGTMLYVDQEVMLLGNEFDPTTYNGPMGSAYGDASLEMLFHPVVALGEINGQYFGLDDEGLRNMVNRTSGFRVSFDPEALPDMRKVDVDGKQVYFPTQQMLEKMGVMRRGVDLAEPVNNAGILSFLLRNTTMGDETPSKEEALPEIELPGLDPFELVRINGELPKTGILLEAKMTRNGNAVFQIYDYDNLERVSLEEFGEDDEYQKLRTEFRWDDDSHAREVDFTYEVPNYPDKDVPPYNRGDEYSYIGCDFDGLDAIDLPNGGRLLISKKPTKLGGLYTQLDQSPWKNTFYKGADSAATKSGSASEASALVASSCNRKGHMVSRGITI